METSGKRFQIEVVGIYETRADSFEEAYATLERALDLEEPIVLKHAMTESLKRGANGKPYPFILACVKAIVRTRIERLRTEGYLGEALLDRLEADNYEEAVG